LDFPLTENSYFWASAASVFGNSAAATPDRHFDRLAATVDEFLAIPSLRAIGCTGKEAGRDRHIETGDLAHCRCTPPDKTHLETIRTTNLEEPSKPKKSLTKLVSSTFYNRVELTNWIQKTIPHIDTEPVVDCPRNTLHLFDPKGLSPPALGRSYE
jgi:hypothetical protein